MISWDVFLDGRRIFDAGAITDPEEHGRRLLVFLHPLQDAYPALLAAALTLVETVEGVRADLAEIAAVMGWKLQLEEGLTCALISTWVKR